MEYSIYHKTTFRLVEIQDIYYRLKFLFGGDGSPLINIIVNCCHMQSFRLQTVVCPQYVHVHRLTYDRGQQGLI